MTEKGTIKTAFRKMGCIANEITIQEETDDATIARVRFSGQIDIQEDIGGPFKFDNFIGKANFLKVYLLKINDDGSVDVKVR